MNHNTNTNHRPERIDALEHVRLTDMQYLARAARQQQAVTITGMIDELMTITDGIAGDVECLRDYLTRLTKIMESLIDKYIEAPL